MRWIVLCVVSGTFTAALTQNDHVDSKSQGLPEITVQPIDTTTHNDAACRSTTSLPTTKQAPCSTITEASYPSHRVVPVGKPATHGIRSTKSTTELDKPRSVPAGRITSSQTTRTVDATSVATDLASCQLDEFRAIAQFCSRIYGGVLRVPSDYAASGSMYGNVRVSVQGDCDTFELVPTSYCWSSFMAACSSKDKRALFGLDMCQTFLIERVHGV